MKIELTDEEWTTVLVALDGYGARKRIEWLDSRDDDDLTEAGSAEWCWHKIQGARETERNSIADAVGEGETTTRASVDPFGLPTRGN
jgi:hypothetical protein